MWSGAELLDRLLVHCDDLVLLGDVGLDHQRLAPVALDLVGDLLGRLGMRHVIDHDIRARSAPSRCATASPIPELAPVTIAGWPVSIGGIANLRQRHGIRERHGAAGCLGSRSGIVGLSQATMPEPVWISPSCKSRSAFPSLASGEKEERRPISPRALADFRDRSRCGGCSRSATNPVHPVWCAAPRPRPVSAVEVLVEQDQVAEMRVLLHLLANRRRWRRRPFLSRRKRCVSRRAISWPIWPSFILLPEPVGHSSSKSSP